MDLSLEVVAPSFFHSRLCLGHLVVTANLVGQVLAKQSVHNSGGCYKVHFWYSVAFIQKSYICMLHKAA